MEQIPEFIDLPNDNPCAKIAPVELLEQLLLLTEDEKTRAINFIGSSLNLKTISEAKQITGKSYSGIKNFGKVVKLLGKNFVIT